MLKRFHPPKNDHLFLSDSETDSDDGLDNYVGGKHLYQNIRSHNKEKSIKKECKGSNYKKKITIVNEESSQDREAFKEETENEVIKEAKRYQDSMKKFPMPDLILVPEPVPEQVSVSFEPSFTTWQKLAKSMKQKYEQPLHYLTQILLKQWDESRGNGIDNNEVMMKKQPIGNVIDPSKAEATVWVIEQFNRQFASHQYVAKLWLSDPKYHHFVDDLQNYPSP